MRRLWRKILYLLIISVVGGLSGGFIGRHFRTDVFPFRPYAFEQGGRFYDRFHIRRWKDKVPDLSKFLRSLPRKALIDRSCGRVKLLVQETCVAEIVHTVLIVLSLPVFFVDPEWESAVLVIVYNIVGNVPFIMIQRYNRPRLLRLAEKLERREEACGEREEIVDGQVDAV